MIVIFLNAVTQIRDNQFCFLHVLALKLIIINNNFFPLMALLLFLEPSLHVFYNSTTSPGFDLEGNHI